MDESDKTKLSVIGKSKKPRCFPKNCKLPVDCYHNNSSWMTTEIFGQIMSKLNEKFAREKRNVLIFVDQFVCHRGSDNYSNIKITFLPTNTTSELQPCDAGIIRWLKQDYRKSLMRKLLSLMKSNKNVKLKDITLLNAIFMLNSALIKLKPSCIINCFKKCGFNSNTTSIDISDDDEPDDINWNEVQQLFHYVSFDDSLSVSVSPDEKSIADQIFGIVDEELIDDGEETSLDCEEDTDYFD